MHMTAHLGTPGRETLTRVKTGVIGAAILLALILGAGHFGVSLVAAILGGVMCWELAHIFFKLSDRREKAIALVGTSWLIIFVNMIFPKTGFECLLAAFMGMFVYFLTTAERHSREVLQQHFNELVFTVFALVYVVMFISFLPAVRAGANGSRWVLLFLLVVWAGDTGAYFVGRKYGKRKLYPLISPGKTLEGAAGGLGASVVVALLFKLVAFPALGIPGALVVGLLIGAVSQIGDLCESFFKRAYGVKDTGRLLPGHGGMLDRFDGVLFSLPFMYFCVRVFG